MLGKNGDLKDFNSLGVEDKDLTVFTIENLVLSEDKNRILMKIVLKRKIMMEMMTTNQYAILPPHDDHLCHHLLQAKMNVLI